MRNVLKMILMLAFLSIANQSVKAQNVIMLKDRLYYNQYGFQIPMLGDLNQARIIDGYIYTTEIWYKNFFEDYADTATLFFAKYDLNGNLLVRKPAPFQFKRNVGLIPVEILNNSPSHTRTGKIQIFKVDQNNFVCYVPSTSESATTQILYKFNTNLDSVRMLKPTLKVGPIQIYSAEDRQCIQTKNGDFIILNQRDNDSGRILNVQKFDKNLSLLWSKEIKPDSTRVPYRPDFLITKYPFKYSSFEEVNGNIVIATVRYDYYRAFSQDTLNNDPNLSEVGIVVYTINPNGQLIKEDSFNVGSIMRFSPAPLSYNTSLFIHKLIPIQNGYRAVFFQTESIGVTTLIIVADYDTILKTATLINSYNHMYDMFNPDPIFKKGFMYYDKFYNFNNDYSSATLNQKSVKPVPDSFYMYYANRFIKAGFYTTWFDENIDSSYLMLGRLSLVDSLEYMSIIQLPNTYGSYYGKVYKDNNKNCAFDTITDKPYKNRTIEITKTNAPVPYRYYDFTDDNGKFDIYADTGQFSAKVYPPSNLWNACPTTHNFTLNSINDSVTQNFYLQRLVNCPKLSVSIAIERLRPCFTNTYFVNYKNNGTTVATNAFVTVAFDSMLTVNSASVPYTQLGNMYTFQIGNIEEDNSGQFSISTTLNCAATLGSTHCVTAHIYPDSSCVAPNPNWNNANVAVDGTCTGDSVRFRIRNIGTGNMTQPKKYFVVEDHVLRIAPQNFQLNAGQELIVKLDATGRTFRLTADQVDNFPYPSNPTAVVENCGGLNPGFVNSFPNDDAADFIAINCTQNIGSYDPNDKIGVPEGVNAQHYIAKNTDIDYKIRFQNTGTDTAYDVYILDTLSSKLNVSTLQMGAASHAYRYEIYGDGIAVLKVVFPNINLVDSFHNEPLSHGFFTYRIAQDTANVDGDRIYNHANIYFDANQPVRTNTTLHTVAQDFFRIISSAVENKMHATTFVYPNPFNDKCTIEIKTDKVMNGNYHFTLYDLKGQLIQEQSVQNKVELFARDLPSNIYLFRIEKDGELIGAGKILKE